MVNCTVDTLAKQAPKSTPKWKHSAYSLQWLVKQEQLKLEHTSLCTLWQRNVVTGYGFAAYHAAGHSLSWLAVGYGSD
jgi:hypothetical protein